MTVLTFPLVIAGTCFYSLGGDVYHCMLNGAHAAQRRLLVQARRYCNIPRLPLVRNGEVALRELRRHQVHPPLHHTVGFRKEPVTADIHSVSLIANCA